ncbi:DUF1236 domain-containing protein [Sulfitobacter sp. HNIBRBA3233]|uniref:DUF1236 domain-containing protein n=1 Tax=Sulfitobacter marinivivus TaxID=3158558 RepID=UPI0032DED8E4
MISAIALATAFPVAAQTATAATATEASAVTNLNVRSGPGPQYNVVGVIPGGDAATLDGCLESGSWCKVNYGDTQGWAYAPYLAVSVDEQVIVVPERPQTVEISTVTYEDTAETADNQRTGGAAGATIGALVAYAIGGPVGGVIAGGILGGAAGSAAVEPSTETITYIESNPVETVYLDGEVAVGAGVPSEVTTYELPEAEYRYVNINGQTVLLDPETGVIVQVIR